MNYIASIIDKFTTYHFDKGIKLIMVLTAIIILYFIVEKIIHEINLRKIRLRILVNGTRGKTTLARLIAATLNNSGIRTVCRTTGSEAEIVFPDGHTEKVKRWKSPRITELKAFVRLAAKNKAECIVTECMALSRENQKTVADHLVKPHITVITNSYVDHMDQVGTDEEETAYTLSFSSPKKVKLFVTEDYYDLPHTVKVPVRHFDIESDTPVHDANISLAIAVAESLGIKEDVVLSSIKDIKGDIGMIKRIEGKNGSVLLPLFSVNDLKCMASSIEDAIRGGAADLHLIFSSRKDREYRIALFVKATEQYRDSIKSVVIIGHYPGKVSRYISKKTGLNVVTPTVGELGKEIDESQGRTYLALGNIKGDGEKLISLFLEGDDR